MVRYNYVERGQEALLVKPKADQRDGARFVASRAGELYVRTFWIFLYWVPVFVNAVHSQYDLDEEKTAGLYG